MSTIPLTHLLDALGKREPNLPLKFRSMVFVFLEVPKPRLSEFSWIYFPDPEICFQRCTDFALFDADMAPPGRTGACFEISCFPEDDIWSARDEDVIERVRRDLETVGLLDRGTPCKAHVARQRFAYPIQTSGYLETVHELLGPVRELKNLVSTGRQGLFKYCNINECMEMALAVAEDINRGVGRFKYELDSRWRGAGLETERTLEDVSA